MLQPEDALGICNRDDVARSADQRCELTTTNGKHLTILCVHLNRQFEKYCMLGKPNRFIFQGVCTIRGVIIPHIDEKMRYDYT